MHMISIHLEQTKYSNISFLKPELLRILKSSKAKKVVNEKEWKKGIGNNFFLMQLAVMFLIVASEEHLTLEYILSTMKQIYWKQFFRIAYTDHWNKPRLRQQCLKYISNKNYFNTFCNDHILNKKSSLNKSKKMNIILLFK